jgi:hypothetical protein
MPAEERRRYALTGPPPPAWFTGLQPGPWITGRVISEGRKLPGERKLPDGRPYWTPAALRSWQSKRKIAGTRMHDEDPA